MEIYDELGTIQVEPFDTFTERLNETLRYYGRILMIYDDANKMEQLLVYCKEYGNTGDYNMFLSQIRNLKESRNV